MSFSVTEIPKQGALAHGKVSHLIPPAALSRLATAWLEEDTPSFDYGGFVVGDGLAEARLLGKAKVRRFASCFMAAATKET